ncbi:glycogen-debranching protein [Synechococcus sp. RSCCF101]|uniref:glycogen debranching protein n=1 Tax=Synechococcus sp. RSCCF101 TaxID=2511069 RepID=UPI00124460B0|nr:isoamylase [Synechococcus sp. RSCCF101]QEY31044.1 glycogen-debranching protein [Synechococcus sp. RSCCF101]
MARLSRRICATSLNQLSSADVTLIHRGRPWPLGSCVTARGVNFSVVAPAATRVELLLYADGQASEPARVIALGEENRSGDHWHVEVEETGIGTCYGYRVFGPLEPGGHGFNPSKVLLDPCARAISGWPVYRRDLAVGRRTNSAACLKGVVTERERFDFQSAPRPRHRWRDSVIYELHVGGFSRGDGCGVAPERQGTLLGLRDKLPYLKDLGVTAVELLPLMAFDPADAPTGRQNYWGYSPISWMALHPAYQVGRDPLAGRAQLRELVAACHRHGIEVILDVVYNHTSEGNQDGPTLSWRGFGDRLYYHQNARGDYLDVSGCGNTIAAHRPLVRRLILESLRCWALELGIDGFRFDLGVALSRGEGLTPLDHPPVFEEMEADPELSDLKLISEPWDCGGLYRLNDFPARRVATWNGRFRDDVRRFWKGDSGTTWPISQRLSGSPDLFDGRGAGSGRLVNFLTAHDGFTLLDLLSYNRKHNLANGESNRDGDNHNNSWNHGVEGPCSDPAVQALRARQQRNLLASLMLSPGTPMLLMGDEVNRSQGGNNNTWCQNNPLGWMHWPSDEEAWRMREFLRRLLRLRRELADVIDPATPMSNAAAAPESSLVRRWRSWHGVSVQQPDWAEWSHSIAWSVEERHGGARLWCGMNAYHEPMEFTLPICQNPWLLRIDTARPAGEDLPATPEAIGGATSVPLQPRSLVLLTDSGGG